MRSLYEKEASLSWWLTDATTHALFVSDAVLAELAHPAFPLAAEALRFVRDVPSLSASDAAAERAEVLIERMVMPQPIAGDAMHVAIAVVERVD